MNQNKLAHGISNFLLYKEDFAFIGMTDITLPNLQMVTETLTGAGLGGNIEIVYQAFIDVMDATYQFRTFSPESAQLFEQREHKLEARAAQQSRDSITGVVAPDSVKYIFRGAPKGLNAGALAPAQGGQTQISHSLSYYCIQIKNDNGQWDKVVEVDPYQYICIVNGIDYGQPVRAALGLE